MASSPTQRRRPLTPDEIKAVAEAHARLGNYAAVARELGLDESTVRKALKRVGSPDRSGLNARACEEGLELGRVALTNVILAADDQLAGCETAQQYHLIAGALARATEALLRVAMYDDEKRGERLARDKTRAETAVLKAKARGELPPDVTVNVSDPAAVDELVRKHFGQSGARRGPVTADAPVADRTGDARS